MSFPDPAEAGARSTAYSSPHDPEVCGLDYATDCAVCRAAADARHGHLDRPGPQPHNRIAGTAEAQLARASRPQPTARLRHHRWLARLAHRQIRELLARELSPAVRHLVLAELARRNGDREENSHAAETQNAA
jgi:hypothetical protein